MAKVMQHFGIDKRLKVVLCVVVETTHLIDMVWTNWVEFVQRADYIQLMRNFSKMWELAMKLNSDVLTQHELDTGGINAFLKNRPTMETISNMTSKCILDLLSGAAAAAVVAAAEPLTDMLPPATRDVLSQAGSKLRLRAMVAKLHQDDHGFGALEIGDVLYDVAAAKKAMPQLFADADDSIYQAKAEWNIQIITIMTKASKAMNAAMPFLDKYKMLDAAVAADQFDGLEWMSSPPEETCVQAKVLEQAASQFVLWDTIIERTSRKVVDDWWLSASSQTQFMTMASEMPSSKATVRKAVETLASSMFVVACTDVVDPKNAVAQTAVYVKTKLNVTPAMLAEKLQEKIAVAQGTSVDALVEPVPGIGSGRKWKLRRTNEPV